jgi:hypothetical protein
MHKIKLGLRYQDVEGIHLPSFRFSWKLKKHCRVDFFVFESWQTVEDVMVLPCDFTAVCRVNGPNSSLPPNNVLSPELIDYALFLGGIHPLPHRRESMARIHSMTIEAPITKVSNGAT